MWRASLLAALLLVSAARAQDAPSQAELRAAIDLLKSLHINRAGVNWPAVEREAFRRIGSGRAAADAYPAIRYVIAQLNEKHTLLIEADQWEADMTGKPVGGHKPIGHAAVQFRALDEQTGYIAVPVFMGDERAIAAYMANFKANLENLRRGGACRFVVDLRGNMGGNMWPMLNGLASLLGDPPYGYFETNGAITSTWAPKNGEILPLDGLVAPTAPPHADALEPVALLIDGKTASSGEFVAIAFEGRTLTRSFGERTAGFVAVNDLYALPDGARLALAVGVAQDRLHRSYRTALDPDEVSGDALSAAQSWLRAQRCAAN